VPGDIIYVEEGTKIPADGKITETKHFEINESP
jgi:magnesium-transporting ATPase (P-type)